MVFLVSPQVCSKELWHYNSDFRLLCESSRCSHCTHQPKVKATCTGLMVHFILSIYFSKQEEKHLTSKWTLQRQQDSRNLQVVGMTDILCGKRKKKDACKITLSPCCLHERINLPAWACSNLILSFLGSKEPEECVWNVTFHMQIPENAVFGQ